MLTDELREVCVDLVNEGRITARCSNCRAILTPEEHKQENCPVCGPLEGMLEPIYFVPS